MEDQEEGRAEEGGGAETGGAEPRRQDCWEARLSKAEQSRDGRKEQRRRSHMGAGS